MINDEDDDDNWNENLWIFTQRRIVSHGLGSGRRHPAKQPKWKQQQEQPSLVWALRKSVWWWFWRRQAPQIETPTFIMVGDVKTYKKCFCIASLLFAPGSRHSQIQILLFSLFDIFTNRNPLFSVLLQLAQALCNNWTQSQLGEVTLFELNHKI